MNKYLFIDTNIYKYLFHENSSFSTEVVNLLLKLLDNNKITLILPDQVREEVERNHLEKWFNDDVRAREKKFEKYKTSVEKQISDLETFDKVIKILRKEITSEEKNKNKDVKEIEYRYRNNNSSSIENFSKLKAKAKTVETSIKILEQSEIRNKKRNPPFDKDKQTDSIIWESILELIRTDGDQSSRTELYFIADDKNAWGYKGFNPFLENELRAVNSKIKIIHRHSIQCLGELFSLDVAKIEKEEKIISKNNAVNTFCLSTSWIEAGNNFRELLSHRQYLDQSDFEKIIKASISNPQIYNSFFVNMNNLIEDKSNSGFAINLIEGVDDGIWSIFRQKNNVTLTRKRDQIEDNAQEQLPENN